MDNLPIGLAITVIGVVMVFIILSLIIFLLTFLKNFSMKSENKAPVTTTEPQKPKTESVASKSSSESSDPAIPADVVAAITAAIAMQYANSESGFIVRSIKRATSGSWNNVAKREQQHRSF